MDPRPIDVKDKYEEALRENTLHITFEKVNGDLRGMSCTLMEKYLPAKEETPDNVEKKPRETNDETLIVWDLDKEAWRSIRIKSIIGVTIV